MADSNAQLISPGAPRAQIITKRVRIVIVRQGGKDADKKFNISSERTPLFGAKKSPPVRAGSEEGLA